MKKSLSLFLSIALIFLLFFTGCGKKSKYVIAVDCSYIPFSYLDSNENPTGFEIDLINAIAKEMDLNTEIQIGEFLDNLSLLDEKEVDAVIQAMIPTEEMNKKYTFSDFYYEGKYALAVNKGKNRYFIDKFNEGLSAITDNGIYQEIYKEYFG